VTTWIGEHYPPTCVSKNPEGFKLIVFSSPPTAIFTHLALNNFNQTNLPTLSLGVMYFFNLVSYRNENFFSCNYLYPYCIIIQKFLIRNEVKILSKYLVISQKIQNILTLQGIMRYYEVLQGITRYYEVLQGITRYYEVLRGITSSYGYDIWWNSKYLVILQKLCDQTFDWKMCPILFKYCPKWSLSK
jgi:hypothetical protein